MPVVYNYFKVILQEFQISYNVQLLYLQKT